MKNNNLIVTQVFLCVFVPLFVMFAIIKFGPNSVARLFLNPDKLKSIIEYDQKKEYEALTKKTASAIEEDLKSKSGNLLNNALDPVLGNRENPSITIVEYLDYRCGYCKKAHDEISKLLSDEKYKGKIRVIIKNYPVIGGEVSLYAAEIATSVFKKNPAKFEEFHLKLFNTQLTTQKDVDKVLESIGMKYDDIKSEDVRQSIISNFNFAREINVSGTPAFIIGNEFIGGFITYEQMSRKIDEFLESKSPKK